MSIKSRTDRDSITWVRNSGSQNSVGDWSSSYSTSNRGTRPTSMQARAIPMSARELVQAGLRGDRAVWKILTSTDPETDMKDAVTFTDQAGTTHTELKVIEPGRNLDNQGRLWRTLVEEVSTKQ